MSSSKIRVYKHIDERCPSYQDAIVCQSNLVRNGIFSWKESIGYKFSYSYQGLQGMLTVIDYDIPTSTFTIKFDEYEGLYSIGLKAFKKCGFINIFAIHYYKFKLGDIVSNKKILNVQYNPSARCIQYLCECVYDGNIYWANESNLLTNAGLCRVCQNRQVIIGVNDVATTDPWMIPYFPNGITEAQQYTSGSVQSIQLQCPDCGRLKTTTLSNLKRQHKLHCVCASSVSFPERFVGSLLDSLHINYIHQCGNKILPWIEENRFYDFYLPDYSMIIETHGKQHYEAVTTWHHILSFEERQHIDETKRQMAIQNGIRHYIIIDCRKSSAQWIKQNILASALPIVLNFTNDNVDWHHVEECSIANLPRQVCQYKNDHPMALMSEVASKFHIDPNTVRIYWNQGHRLGWCHNNSRENRWIGSFHRNTHYEINGHLFYNVEDITHRSLEILGEQVRGGSIAQFVRNGYEGKLFKGKYKVRPLSHAEYVLSHPIYPEYVSQHTIDALYQSYLNAESKEENNELFDVSTFKQIKNISEPMCEELATPLSV